MKKVVIGVLFALLLTACGTTISQNDKATNGSNGAIDTNEEMYEGVSGFIVSFTDNSMLVIGVKDHQEATYYSLNDKTIVENSNGDWLAVADLQVGQFVDTFYQGAIAESYPAQGRAAKVIVHQGGDYPPATGIANAIASFEADEDAMPYIYQFEKADELWVLDIAFLNNDLDIVQVKVNETGDIVE
jgi:ABC-type uncharacterized transport system auxiliary subunit